MRTTGQEPVDVDSNHYKQFECQMDNPTIDEIAARAHVLFGQFHLTYGFGKGFVPDVAELKRTIEYLINSMDESPKTQSTETGRFLLRRSENDELYTICIEVGFVPTKRFASRHNRDATQP